MVWGICENKTGYTNYAYSTKNPAYSKLKFNDIWIKFEV